MRIICQYFLFFMIYSILGWILEVICKLITHKRFINRGFLIGPYCPIYGWGVLFMELALNRYLEDPITLFIMIVLSMTILEYFTSWILEVIFKTRWWDYSTYRFNINGRVCLETMLPFGLAGLFVMYIANPIVLNLISSISETWLYTLSAIIFLGYIVDNILSFKILLSLKDISSKVRTDSTEKITKKVKQIIIKNNKTLEKRIIGAFPHLQIYHTV